MVTLRDVETVSDLASQILARVKQRTSITAASVLETSGRRSTRTLTIFPVSTIVSSPHAVHRVHELTGIEKVGNHGLGAAALEQMAACVPHADGDPYGPTFGQQFSDYHATGSSVCAGYRFFGLIMTREEE